VLESTAEVTRCLGRYHDWYQPGTTSLMQLGGQHRNADGVVGFRGGFLETVDERIELCRRLESIDARDCLVLFLWYVVGLPPGEVARRVGISRRHCFRRRAEAVRRIVDLGEVPS